MKKRKRADNNHRLGKSSFEVRMTSARGAQGSWRLLTMIVLCLLAAGWAGPQVLAKKKPAPVKTISGAVLTASNAGVPGASVILTDLETHRTDAIYSGANGKYNFSGLNPNDDYRVHATYKQLVSDTRNVSSLDSRAKIVINLVLAAPGSNASAAPQ